MTRPPENGRPDVLRFEEVGRVYEEGPQTVRALGPVTASFVSGEFVAIMGPSGSGKSTLLSLAGALDVPTEGAVFLFGRDLATSSRQDLAALRRRRIGFVFQDLNLLPGLTALENVALPLELDGVSLSEARAEATRALERIRMERFAGRFPHDLSGGEAQRIAIARAIVGDRSLLLADEPTGALDSVTGEQVMRLLRERSEAGGTVVLVTHDASHAAWADRVLFLRDGRIESESRGAEGFKPGILDGER